MLYSILLEEHFKWFEIPTADFKLWWVTAPKVALSIAVFATIFFIGKLFKKLTGFIVNKFSAKSQSGNVLGSLVFSMFFCVGLLIVFDILNLDNTISSVFASAGIIGLTLGFAFQDVSANLISGIYFAFRRPFSVGDLLETNGYKGIVEQIDLRSTIIRTYQGLQVMIPNKEIFQKANTNYSNTFERRVDLDFTIVVNPQTLAIHTLIKNEIDSLPYINKAKPVEIYFTGIHENMITIVIWFWIYNDRPPGYMKARHDAIINIIRAFHENSILHYIQKG